MEKINNPRGPRHDDEENHTERIGHQFRIDNNSRMGERQAQQDNGASLVDFPVLYAGNVVTRDYSSLTFLHEAAIKGINKPTQIYHLGDFDPSGVDAARKIAEELFRMAPYVEINFESIAVTPTPIRDRSLPSCPTKKTDSRAAKFGDYESVELDAIPPGQLRWLVEQALERHIPAHEFGVLKAAEDSERQAIAAFVGRAA